MNPTSNKQSRQSREIPTLNLPPPVAEQLPTTQGPEVAPEQARRAAVAPERAPSSAAAGAAAAQPPIPLPPINDNSTWSPQIDVTATSQPASSSLIKDDDLIEKEWVNRAKRIVERTRDDPHQQSEQLTLVKADYMKKRYNKTVKVSK